MQFEMINSSRMPLSKFGGTSRGLQNKYKRKRTESQSFPLTSDGDYDFGNRKLCNVRIPTEKSDVVTKEILDNELLKVINLMGDLGIRVQSIKNELELSHEKIISDVLSNQEKCLQDLKQELREDFRSFVIKFSEKVTKN